MYLKRLVFPSVERDYSLPPNPLGLHEMFTYNIVSRYSFPLGVLLMWLVAERFCPWSGLQVRGGELLGSHGVIAQLKAPSISPPSPGVYGLVCTSWGYGWCCPSPKEGVLGEGQGDGTENCLQLPPAKLNNDDVGVCVLWDLELLNRVYHLNTEFFPGLAIYVAMYIWSYLRSACSRNWPHMHVLAG